MKGGKKVLYISSFDPSKGVGAIAMDHFKALINNGLEVDFLTKFPVEGHPEILYVLKKPINKYVNFIKRFPYYFLKKYKKSNKNNTENIRYFTHRKESEPPVPVNKILKKIDNDYELIIIYFWQGLLTYKTIKKIYDHNITSPKFVFLCPDYTVMTGGCDHIGNCNRYDKGCGYCPMIGSKKFNDFTSWNVKYSAKVVDKIKPYIIVNNYMLPFFEKSPILKNCAGIIKGNMIIDLQKFKPLPIDQLRLKYKIPKQTKFIILFGAQNLANERKGIKYLIESLHQLYNKLSDDVRKQILLLIVGKSENINNLLPEFPQKYLGYVSTTSLPEIYSMSNVFVSPSVNDPGPSMVNQSIACGTPVVSFEMGTALDVIKGRGTGVCVPLKDTKGMADGIFNILQMDKQKYNQLRETCRKIAEELHSYKTFSDKIKELISSN